MERSERMKKAYEYLRFQGLAGTQEDVADMLKRQRTNVSSALNGNPKYLTDKFIEDFCKTFGTINPNWLITGEGSMLISDDNCQADPKMRITELYIKKDFKAINVSNMEVLNFVLGQTEGKVRADLPTLQ